MVELKASFNSSFQDRYYLFIFYLDISLGSDWKCFGGRLLIRNMEVLGGGDWCFMNYGGIWCGSLEAH